MTETNDWRDGAALLIMRLSLAWFMFLWAAHKIIAPKQYQGLARHFDGVDLSFAQIYAVAGVQIAICGLVALGLFRAFSYSALLLMHLFTISRQWERYFDPFKLSEKGFPVNRNMVIALAALGAMIALVLLIRRDRWSLGGWLARRFGRRWWL